MPHYAGCTPVNPGFRVTVWITGQYCGTRGRTFYTQFMITVDQVWLILIKHFMITVLVVLYGHNRTP
jgi:hypothetical protein